MPLPPDQAAWPAPEGPRPRRGRGVALGVASALVLTGVVGTGVVVATRGHDRGAAAPVATATSPVAPVSSVRTQPPPPPSSSPTTAPSASPAPTRTASPTAAPGPATPVAPIPTTRTSPTPPPAPTGPNRTLRQNTLYGVDLGGRAVSCDLEVRRPKPPLPDKRLAPYLRDVVSCLTKAFTDPLAAKGFHLVEPKIRTYHASVTTPCGKFGQRGSPAYYCSTTQTIYWPDTVDDGNEAYTFARLGYVGLVAHEFGHHLQATTGMLGEYAYVYGDASKSGRYALSRRLELQAQCFEGVFLDVARHTVHLAPADRAELRTWHSYTGDEDPPSDRKPDHGTSKEQYRWLERGLDSGDFGRCNTWTAAKRSV